MNLGITVSQIEGGDYLAEVDWSKGDAGKVGTPGAIKYGESKREAYDKLRSTLQSMGHTIIEPV